MKKKGVPDREIGNRAAATKDYDELLLSVVELLEVAVTRQRVPFTRS
jgi:hypothetical protein